MKKILQRFFYAVIILFTILYIVKYYYNYQLLKEIKIFLGIKPSTKIEIIKSGGSKEPPEMFMVLKLEQEVPKDTLEKEYKFGNTTLMISRKYINSDQPYFYKEGGPELGNGILKREVIVQGKMVFYKVNYTN